MWETKIGKSIERHFRPAEDDHWLHLTCRRCNQPRHITAQTPLIYILAECIHHLQHVHGFPGAIGAWQGYLDALPAPENPS